MDHKKIKFLTPSTVVLLLLLGIGGIAGVYRLIHGLGAVTNLSNLWPWGLWISLDVLGGVAMAAGGFIIAGTVYILNWKKYKPIVRPAILNAFFGYIVAAGSIFFDIGMPFRVWHPMVMWQVHSVMFVVAIHVVLYSSTLALESSPMIFEKLGMDGAYRFVNRIMVPIVIFGVLLSVLHQSSLGAVFLILPTKLSPLWHSGLLPYHFLVSAVVMGLSMVSFEAVLSRRAFGHKTDMSIMSGLARGSQIALGVYLLMKLWTLFTGPGLGAAFAGDFAANMYLLEMALGVLLPLALFSMAGVRSNLRSIFAANIVVIVGILLNRLNVGIFGIAGYASSLGADYFPSFGEFALTGAMVAFAVLGFKLSAMYLNLYPKTEH
ncbi:MAG: NrfD/PsrC family molybdoenzyme membrane anchor subunit [Candidatus Methylomirabilia bacterium]